MLLFFLCLLFMVWGNFAIANEVIQDSENPDSIYICPMHPHIHGEHDDTCPICGMGLELKHISQVSTSATSASGNDEQSNAEHSSTGHARGNEKTSPGKSAHPTNKLTHSSYPQVQLKGNVIQQIGVRTATVEKRNFTKAIKTQGRVVPDVDRMVSVSTRAPGWIENLFIREAGERVQRGDELADIVSPYMLAAQSAYLSQINKDELASFNTSFGPIGDNKTKEKNTSLLGARDLLRYLKIPERHIQNIEDSATPRQTVPLHAPQGGIVTWVGTNEGRFVYPEDTLFTILDLSEVWVLVDVYEHQISSFQAGQTATITSSAYPGETWEGIVEFIYPELNPISRTVVARLEFRTPQERLLPNMYVEARVNLPSIKNALVIPKEALIKTGKREVVVKALGNGIFEPVDVVTGDSQDDEIVVLAGLKQGDTIVTSGQFLIDSESNLRASFKRMQN